MASAIYTLGDFVEDAKRIAAEGKGEEATRAALIAPLVRIIQRPECLADLEINDNPDPERGFPIYRSPNLSILCVVWQVGSGTPIHNHMSWAIEGVIKGLERNHNYLRLDDASEPWRAKLEEIDPSVVGTGETTELALPPNDIHAVEIPGEKTLAIHIYGCDLARQWRYQFDVTTGEVKPFRSGERTQR